MLQNRTIPKQANFLSLNPSIAPLGPDHITIPTATQQWKSGKRAALVNNYGAAGSNAAIILQEYSQDKTQDVVRRAGSRTNNLPEVPFYVSAKTTESLSAYCSALKSYLVEVQKTSEEALLTDIAYNLATKQNRTLEHSWSFTSQNVNALSNELESLAAKSSSPESLIEERRPIVLCFGGQSGRNVTLSQDLFNSCNILQYHMVRFNFCQPSHP